MIASSQLPFIPPNSQPIREVDTQSKTTPEGEQFPELDKFDLKEGTPKENKEIHSREEKSTKDNHSDEKSAETDKKESEEKVEKGENSENEVIPQPIAISSENLNLRKLITQKLNEESEEETDPKTLLDAKKGSNLKIGIKKADDQEITQIDGDAKSNKLAGMTPVDGKKVTLQEKPALEGEKTASTGKINNAKVNPNSVQNQQKSVENLQKLPEATIKNVTFGKKVPNSPQKVDSESTVKLFNDRPKESALLGKKLPQRAKNTKTLKNKLSEILKPQLAEKVENKVKTRQNPVKRIKPKLNNNEAPIQDTARQSEEVSQTTASTVKAMSSMQNVHSVREFLLNSIKGAITDMQQSMQQSITVAIEHASLGKMNIILNDKNGQLNITLESENAAANSLNSQKTELVSALKAIGYESVSLEFSTNDQQKQHEEQQKSNAESVDNVKLNIGNAKEDDEAVRKMGS